MAKQFAGFTPQQLGRIVPEMANMQADEQAKFLAANPAAAARVGKMSMLAQQKVSGQPVGMADGGFAGIPLGKLFSVALNATGRTANNTASGATSSIASRFMDPSQTGGLTNVVRQPAPPAIDSSQTNLDAAQQAYATAQQKLQDAIAAQQANPRNAALATAVTNAQAAVNAAQANMNSASSAFKATEVPTAAEATAAAFKDPASLVTTADVATPTEAEKQAGMLDAATGQAGDVSTVEATTAETATPVTTPEFKPAATYEALPATASVQDVMSRLEAATGKVGAEALVDAQTMNPQQLAQLGLSASQLQQAQTVQATAPREVQAGELVSGATVDMERVKTETNFEAATGAPSTDATVQGQLTGLMADFEGKEPPAWAAGAMRQAAAAMAARGLGASSLAGQAIVQAAMESAIPIAQADAAAFQRYELQNLSNKQQAAMFAAEQRATFLGLEFNQEFQTRVANAAKISEIANINFTAQQQVALENARMAQSVDLANLSARNAKIMADAAAMSQMDMANLNNRQQAAVQNAKSFLDMDMTNLNNQQQTALFKSQQIASSLLTDAAAENAARQFNAVSENQTNQFFSNLQAQIEQFNTSQVNEMNRFNAGEMNSIDQFNAAARAAREQFNAQNALIVAQANAAWAQKITTAANAEQNQANRDAAIAANNMTMTAYNNQLQLERDTISYAWRSAESQLDRENAIRVQAMANEMSEAQIQANIDMAKGEGTGRIINTFLQAALEAWF